MSRTHETLKPWPSAEADGYLPQIEGPGQYEAALNNFRTGVGAGMSQVGRRHDVVVRHVHVKT